MFQTLSRPRFTWKKQMLAALAAVAAAVVLPQIVHLIGRFTGTGAALGNMLLPMHFPIFLIGLWAGPIAGGVAGCLCPLISYAITGMPSESLVPFMMLELALYGITIGLLRSSNMPEVLKVIVAQVVGRVVRAALILLVFYGLGETAVAPSVIWTSLYMGVLGMAIQWIGVPAVVKALEKR